MLLEDKNAVIYGGGGGIGGDVTRTFARADAHQDRSGGPS
jgi:NAD(P)-dependent dehydrogenase (short-subunit alcohol dehydrogenase family)